MYSLSSASQRCEPCPRTMNGGSPPTAPKGAHRRIHAAGNHLLGAFLQLARSFSSLAGHGYATVGVQTDKYSSS